TPAADGEWEEGCQLGSAPELPAMAFRSELVGSNPHEANGITQSILVEGLARVDDIQQVLDAQLLLELELVEHAALHQLQVLLDRVLASVGLLVGLQRVLRRVRTGRAEFRTRHRNGPACRRRAPPRARRAGAR